MITNLHHLKNTTMSDQDALSNPIHTTDPYNFFDIIRHPDGTFTRKPSRFTIRPTTQDLSYSIPVLSKDVVINQSKNTWARLFLPRQALDSSSAAANAPVLLPLIVYYPGGGLVLSTTAASVSHDFCVDIALQLSVIVVSVDYRVAPENRLPAAYDDAIEALHYIKTVKDDWLKKHADLTKCFLVGTSAGGTVAYHACLRAATQVDDLKPLRINGLVLHYPFFSGAKRTESELRAVNDPVLPLVVCDLAWELCLPIGADRDHQYCNPMVGDVPELLEKVKLLGWKVMATSGDRDLSIDRLIALTKLMDEKGIKVETHIGAGDHHGADIGDPSKLAHLLLALKNFIFSTIVE
ncbi:probable carboxylesterase 120 [Tripterygium wilfordii]|uniref:probable carboxylesterase 120 n=1 Tax=Tripterygium wilfordii TaxID=458696 RepID=UPI0018F83134|nr:probable carboxylesterase 120 [Tripterygium wilfordii]